MRESAVAFGEWLSAFFQRCRVSLSVAWVHGIPCSSCGARRTCAAAPVTSACYNRVASVPAETGGGGGVSGISETHMSNPIFRVRIVGVLVTRAPGPGRVCMCPSECEHRTQCVPNTSTTEPHHGGREHRASHRCRCHALALLLNNLRL